MRLKKYRGRDAGELMARVRRELGEDAVIVATRPVIEGGMLGFFGRSMVEMVVVLPEGEGREAGGGGRVDIAVPGEAPAVSAGRRIPGLPEAARRERGVSAPEGEASSTAGGLGYKRDVPAGEDGEREGSRAPRGRSPLRTDPTERPAGRGGGGEPPDPSCARRGGISGVRRSSGKNAERRCGGERNGAGREEEERGDAEHPREETGHLFVPLRFAAGTGGEGYRGLPERALFLGPSGAGKTTCLGRTAWSLTVRGREVTVLSLEEEGRLSGARRWEELWKNMGSEYRPCLDAEELLSEARRSTGAVLIDTPPLAARDVGRWRKMLEGGLAGFTAVVVLEARMEEGEYAAWLKALEPLRPYLLVISKVDELFDAARAERMAGASGAAEVYLAGDPSVVVPMERFVARAVVGRRPPRRGEETTA